MTKTNRERVIGVVLIFSFVGVYLYSIYTRSLPQVYVSGKITTPERPLPSTGGFTVFFKYKINGVEYIAESPIPYKIEGMTRIYDCFVVSVPVGAASRGEMIFKYKLKCDYESPNEGWKQVPTDAVRLDWYGLEKLSE